MIGHNEALCKLGMTSDSGKGCASARALDSQAILRNEYPGWRGRERRRTNAARHLQRIGSPRLLRRISVGERATLRRHL
jgi:hypothetical protein